MNLNKLKDKELLQQTKKLVSNERQLLTQILHHLKEVGNRKLFSDLGYQSLFEYAVKELKYSEGQAGRRLQALRLIQEIPQVEAKIESGKLNLTNVSKAQSYFREVKKTRPQDTLTSEDKIKVLEKLEGQSTRQSERILIELEPCLALPKERERVLSASHTEIRFVMDLELKHKIEELQSLLGSKAHKMSFEQLIKHMAEISVEQIKKKKFGKKRVMEQAKLESAEARGGLVKNQTDLNGSRKAMRIASTSTSVTRVELRQELPVTPAPECSSKNPRYVRRSIRHQVWLRDFGRCGICQSQSHLQIDHIKPVALGGGANESNLRLLCFHCNQRQAIKSFGLSKIKKSQDRKHKV